MSRRWSIAAGLWAVLSVLLAVWLAPWWRSGTTPVELVMHAPTDADLVLHWETGNESGALRLIPVREQTGDWSWFWTTDLPPRPDYRLRIEVGPTESALAFAELKIWQLSPRKKTLAVFAGTDSEAWHSTTIDVTERGEKRVLLDASAGGTIEFPSVVDSGASWTDPALLGLIGNFWLLGLLIFGLFGAGWTFPAWVNRDPVVWSKRKWFLLGGVFLFSAGLHWHLVTTSLPSFWPADSTSYADKGLALAYTGSFDTGGYEYELNRTPGYPLLLALGFRLFGPSLNASLALQTALSLLAFAGLFLALRRWLPSWVLIAAIPLVLLSPALVWANRQIATESTFVTGWALATAAFLIAQSVIGRRRTLVWTVFCLAVAWTTMIRMNGILLLCLPGCALVGEIVRCRSAGYWRLPRFGRLGFNLIPFAAVLAVLVLWSARNASNRGYARPTDLAPIVAANAPFNAGMLDLRAFPDPEEYAWVVKHRYEAGHFFPGWSLRNHLFREITDNWKNQNETTIDELADALRAFVAENNTYIPLRARLVAWARVLGWGLWTPSRGPFTQDDMLRSYAVPAHYGSEEEWLKETVPQRLQWLHRKRAGDVRFSLLTLEPGQPSRLKDAYNRLAPAYPWVYRLLSLAGVLALVWAVWRRRPVAWVLLVPAFVNVLLNVYFLYVIGRYVHILDGFLLLGILTALMARPLAPSAPDGKTSKTVVAERPNLTLRKSAPNLEP